MENREYEYVTAEHKGIKIQVEKSIFDETEALGWDVISAVKDGIDGNIEKNSK